MTAFVGLLCADVLEFQTHAEGLYRVARERLSNPTPDTSAPSFQAFFGDTVRMIQVMVATYQRDLADATIAANDDGPRSA